MRLYGTSPMENSLYGAGDERGAHSSINNRLQSICRDSLLRDSLQKESTGSQELDQDLKMMS